MHPAHVYPICDETDVIHNMLMIAMTHAEHVRRMPVTASDVRAALDLWGLSLADKETTVSKPFKERVRQIMLSWTNR